MKTALMRYIPLGWIPFLLSSYVKALTVYTSFTTQFYRSWTALRESFDEEKYLFFGNSAPVTYKKRTAHSIPLRGASWMYTYPSNILKEKPFHDSLNVEAHRRLTDIGILSATLKIDENQSHDISTWIESLKVYSFDKTVPSWLTLIRCWILHNEVNIHLPQVTIEYINTDGEDKEETVDMSAVAT